MDKLTVAQATEILRFGIVNYKDGEAIAALIESLQGDAVAMREAAYKDILAQRCEHQQSNNDSCPESIVTDCPVWATCHAYYTTTAGADLLAVVMAADARQKKRWCKGEMPKASCDGCADYEVCKSLAAYRGGALIAAG